MSLNILFLGCDFFPPWTQVRACSSHTRTHSPALPSVHLQLPRFTSILNWLSECLQVLPCRSSSSWLARRQVGSPPSSLQCRPRTIISPVKNPIITKPTCNVCNSDSSFLLLLSKAWFWRVTSASCSMESERSCSASLEKNIGNWRKRETTVKGQPPQKNTIRHGGSTAL